MPVTVVAGRSGSPGRAPRRCSRPPRGWAHWAERRRRSSARMPGITVDHRAVDHVTCRRLTAYLVVTEASPDQVEDVAWMAPGRGDRGAEQHAGRRARRLQEK